MNKSEHWPVQPHTYICMSPSTSPPSNTNIIYIRPSYYKKSNVLVRPPPWRQDPCYTVQPEVFSDLKAELNHYMKESRFKGADDIIDDMAKHKKFPPQSRDPGPEIRRTEEYRWRTQTMNQLGSTALSQMIRIPELQQSLRTWNKPWRSCVKPGTR